MVKKENNSIKKTENSKRTRMEVEKLNSKGNKRGVSEASKSNLIPGGNREGRPKGKRDFNTLVDLAIEKLAYEYLEQNNDKAKRKLKNEKTGIPYVTLKIEDIDIEGDIFRQYLNQARSGNLKAIDSYLDRRHGKAKQPVELSGVDGKAIEYDLRVKEYEADIIANQSKWFKTKESTED